MASAPREIWAVCRIPHTHIYHLRYTLDAHEGLCVATTLRHPEGRVRLLTSEDRRAELERVLAALAGEVPLEVLEWGRGSLLPGEEPDLGA